MTRRKRGLLLFPGAGGDRTHHTLAAIEDALLPRPVARVDFEYRKAGRRAPDRAPVLLETVRSEAAQFAHANRLRPAHVALGGRSMGGRICSIAVAEGLPAAGLVLLSYPLHPPGKPERLRTEHFARLALPCLFIGGTRDPFGTPEELTAATQLIPGPVTHVWLEGARHDPKGVDDEVTAAVRAWIATL